MKFLVPPLGAVKSHKTCYTDLMIEKTVFVLYKNIPSERYAPYKDRHRPIHARNQEVIKTRMKVEKRLIEHENAERIKEEIRFERRIEKEIAAHKRLLNII